VLIIIYSSLAHVLKALLQKKYSNYCFIFASYFLLYIIIKLVCDLKLLILALYYRGLISLIYFILEFLVLTLLYLVKF